MVDCGAKIFSSLDTCFKEDALMYVLRKYALLWTMVTNNAIEIH